MKFYSIVPDRLVINDLNLTDTFKAFPTLSYSSVNKIVNELFFILVNGLFWLVGSFVNKNFSINSIS